MNRLERTLRHVSMLFILMSLLSPLSAYSASAQASDDASPAAIPGDQDAPADNQAESDDQSEEPPTSPEANDDALNGANGQQSQEEEAPGAPMGILGNPKDPVIVDHKIWICHANNGNGTGGYNYQDVDYNSIIRENGHQFHQNGRDIIPPIYDVNGDLVFAGQGNQDRLENSCDPVVVVPTTPTFNEVECGVVPTVNVPEDSRSITYTLAGPDGNGKFTITARTTSSDYIFKDGMTGWEYVDASTATYSGQLIAEPCPIITAPAEVQWSDTTCTDGELVAPTFTMPTDGNGVTYTSNPSPVDVTPGKSATLTATLDSTYIWGDSMNGWTSSESGREATITITFDNPECDPDLALTKSVNVDEAVPGSQIIYTITVSNSGPGNAHAVNVQDELPAADQILWTSDDGTIQDGVFTATVDLPVNASEIFIITGTVPANGTVCGDLSNLATATLNETVVRDNVSTRIDCNPDVSIVKSASVDLGEDETLSAGDVITYTVTVTNTGNTTLSDLQLEDELTGGTNSLVWTNPADFDGTIAGPIASLEVVTLTATYTISQDDIDTGTTVQNCASIPAFEVSDCARTSLSGDPVLHIVKTATDIPTPLNVGSTITYTFTVYNDGIVTLEDVQIQDMLSAPADGEFAWTDGNTIASIPVGNSASRTATYTVTQTDMDHGTVLNCATATVGETTSERSCVTVDIKQSPALTITKSASPEKDVVKGDTITYTFVVSNTGNVTLLGVKVIDQMPGLVWNTSTPDGAVGTLAPGQKATLTASYVVTASDVAAGKVHNSAVANGTLPNCEVTCEVISPPAEATVIVKPEAVKPVTPTPPASPVKSLPSTGSGSAETTNQGLAILMLSTGTIALAALALAAQRRKTS